MEVTGAKGRPDRTVAVGRLGAAPPEPSVPRAGAAGWKPYLTNSLLGLMLFLIYWANGHEIRGDTEAAVLLPLAVLQGDGLVLDRFSRNPLLLGEERPPEADPAPARPEGQPPPANWVVWRRGHLVSKYPVGSSVLAVPLYAPQVAMLSWLRPGWEQDQERVQHYACKMGKNSAAVLVALAGVALLHLFRLVGLGRMALPATLAVALGSPLWVSASQSLHQQGPAVLALTLALIALIPQPVSRLRLFLAGLATAALVCFRPLDVLFAFVIFLWVARCHFRRLAWFAVMPVLLGGALISYDYWFFGQFGGGYQEGYGGGKFYLIFHNPLGPGLAGTLLSPSRGLFVFVPWTVLTLVLLPLALPGKLSGRSIVWWLLWAIIPYTVIISTFNIWWAGWCFGPRYWTDVMPLFGILLGFGLQWAWQHSRAVVAAFGITVVAAVAIQTIGAVCYPCSWDAEPVDVDRAPERVWDWRDSVLTRCLTEGPAK